LFYFLKFHSQDFSCDENSINNVSDWTQEMKGKLSAFGLHTDGLAFIKCKRLTKDAELHEQRLDHKF